MSIAALSISPLQPLAVAGRRRSISSGEFTVTARAAVQIPSAASPSPYEILGLAAGANAGEIKTAYRRLARKCHPDTAGAGAGGERSSADDFLRIHAAYSTLSDPEKRADYDRGSVMRSGRRRPPFAGSVRFPAYGRRTWETDQCW